MGLHRWIYNTVTGICSFTFLLKNMQNGTRYGYSANLRDEDSCPSGCDTASWSQIRTALFLGLSDHKDEVQNTFETSRATRPMTERHIQERLASSAILLSEPKISQSEFPEIRQFCQHLFSMHVGRRDTSNRKIQLQTEFHEDQKVTHDCKLKTYLIQVLETAVRLNVFHQSLQPKNENKELRNGGKVVHNQMLRIAQSPCLQFLHYRKVLKACDLSAYQISPSPLKWFSKRHYKTALQHVYRFSIVAMLSSRVLQNFIVWSAAF